MTTVPVKTFYDAQDARYQSLNTIIIHTEVADIETSILTEVQAGNLSVKVDGGTPMTSNVSYYNAYYGVTNDPAKVAELQTVEQHFYNLGYNIRINTNTTTDNTLVWNVNW